MTVPDEKDCSTPHVTLCAVSKSSLFPYSKRKAAQTENINLSINKPTNQPTKSPQHTKPEITSVLKKKFQPILLNTS